MTKNPLRASLFFFAALGAVAVAIALFLWLDWQRFADEREKTFGIVVSNKLDAERDYHPVIRFKTLDNQRVTFTAYRLESKTKYQEGDTVRVYYDLLNPDNAYAATGDEYKGVRLFVAAGLLFLAGGLWGIFSLHTKRTRRQMLSESGSIITGKVLAVRRIESGLAGVFMPYQILCEYEQRGEKMLIESPYIAEDPRAYLRDTINIYIDTQNPKYYTIDLSALPQDWIWQ